MIKATFGVARYGRTASFRGEHRTMLNRVFVREHALLVASAHQVSAPAVVPVEGSVADLNAAALLPVAGRW